MNYLSLEWGDVARQQLLGSRSGASSWPQAQFEPDVCSCQGNDRRLHEQGQERVKCIKSLDSSKCRICGRAEKHTCVGNVN